MATSRENLPTHPGVTEDLDPGPVLGLFEGFGIELEAMLVDSRTFDVRPIADLVLHDLAGRPVEEVARGRARTSNELVMHVLEVKTNGPVPRLGGVAGILHDALLDVDRAASAHGARVLPGAVHPRMLPAKETSVWFHQNDEIYAAFDRIFGVRRHGWANLQSVHVNLPFQGDQELRALHEAVRLLLPIIPGLAAASPYLEGRYTGTVDSRLDVYRTNAARIPSITGHVVPESIQDRAEYESRILAPMYRDIAPHDPRGILCHEWLNARGAIARFDRSAIEIRVVDAQECPLMDLAVVAAVVAVLRPLVAQALERGGPFAPGRAPLSTERLAAILDVAIRDGERGFVGDAGYAAALGVAAGKRHRVGDLWRTLLARHPLDPDVAGELGPAVELLLDQGPLARRMLAFAGEAPSRSGIRELERRLAEGFRSGTPFRTEGRT